MAQTSKRRAAEPAAERSDDARSRLLHAAIDVFGRLGFEAASTRGLATAAGVNLQSIPYYFGGKEGLYLAAAEHIAQSMQAYTRPLALSYLAELAAQGGAPSVAAARAQLLRIVRTMADVFLSAESEPWARFMIREQMEPTAAFEVLYAQVLAPLLDLIGGLLARILGKPADSELVRLRAMSTMGQVLVLRAARATLTRRLGWTELGERERLAVDALVEHLVAGVAPLRSAPGT